MSPQRILKRIHVCGTIWFLMCAAVLLILSLRQTGMRWWLVFSISGYSAVLLFFLFTIYLFAIFQGAVRNQNTLEHPLSTSQSYTALYDLAPFLGSLSGLFATTIDLSWISLLNSIAQGTLAMTFVMWILIDPLVGMIESSLPASVAIRRQKNAEQRKEKIRQKLNNQRLLQRLEEQEKQLYREWTAFFEPCAKEAAALLCDPAEYAQNQGRIIELGSLAWQKGQLICMRYFHQMILNEMKRLPCRPAVDYISLWWDGIGVWRRPPQLNDLLLPK